MEKLMPVSQALRILSEVHTRDDDVAGFRVMMGADYGRHEQGDYIEAWRSVRHALGEQTEPADAPLSKSPAFR